MKIIKEITSDSRRLAKVITTPHYRQWQALEARIKLLGKTYDDLVRAARK